MSEVRQGYSTIITNPNFLGMLYESNVRKTQFLSAIGGIGGSNTMITPNPEFSTGVAFSLENPSQPNISESQSLSTASPTTFPLFQQTNVVQIFQQDTGVSRLRERSKALKGINTSRSIPEYESEVALQIDFHIKNMARQINYTAINGKYDAGGLTNVRTALQTRGIIEAITTNVIDGVNITTTAEEIRDAIDSLFKAVFDNGAWEEPTLVVNSTNKVKISKAYGELGLANVVPDWTAAGINVQMLVTNFANTGAYIIIDNDVPSDTILLCDMAFIHPVFTRDKHTEDLILVHPLSQRGGSLFEIYCEFGLDHGPELYHGKIINFGATT